jgi:hypothetical protein
MRAPGSRQEVPMGMRKSQGKNKKSTRPAAAIAVKRDEAVRKALKPRRGR